MYESKGWFLLLQACKILKKRKIRFKCNFVGGWPGENEKNKFKSFIKAENLESEVKFFGTKTGNEKESFFEKANIFVFPTYYELEAHPRVILEAMMYGLPIIANKHSSISNTIRDRKDGLIIKKNSPEEIAKLIISLDKNKKLREKLGRNARKRFLDNYEMKKYKKKFARIIESSFR
jgi:glycosyltransferase involved in cell wall biosynthesis